MQEQDATIASYLVTREVPVRVVVPVGTPPEGGWPVVLALHGMGETAVSFAELLAPAIAVGGRAWVIPSGPLAFERRREPGIAYAWYIFGGDQERLRRGMAEASSDLGGLLAGLASQQQVNLGAVSVLGFSQGGYLASMLWTHVAGLRGVCCVGGRLKQEWWPDPPPPSAPSFLQLHGADDVSVSPELARKAVDAASQRGYTVEMRVFDGVAHTLDQQMLAAFTGWLAEGGL